MFGSILMNWLAMLEKTAHLKILHRFYYFAILAIFLTVLLSTEEQDPIPWSEKLLIPLVLLICNWENVITTIQNKYS